jgi:hypothetical protein
MIPFIFATVTASSDATRCQPFANDFAQYAACERADGTLRSFAERQIAWRVRYYVRYWEMPCGEFPTAQEAYVFHMVTGDLYRDADLNDAQRVEVRNAMFRGRVGCR